MQRLVRIWYNVHKVDIIPRLSRGECKRAIPLRESTHHGEAIAWPPAAMVYCSQSEQYTIFSRLSCGERRRASRCAKVRIGAEPYYGRLRP